VESNNRLGIYLSEDEATVVCVGPRGRDKQLLACFKVTVQEQTDQKQQALASLIARGCSERGLKFSEAAVALDCAKFMQHNVHSEFTDPKKIAATIRFDTEEALATDITDAVIAFTIKSSDQTGSELTVFTAQRKILSDVLLSLQTNGIDPVTIEPDIGCLSSFICQQVPPPESGRSGTLFVLLSRRRGYFIIVSESQRTFSGRTFLVGPVQDRQALLLREALVTVPLTEAVGPVNCLKIFDSANSIDLQQLSRRLSVEVSDIDLITSAEGAESQKASECADPVDFAIAYGAALACSERTKTINFRNDFMPYQGKRLRLQKALRFLSVSVIVLLFIVGSYAQAKLWQKNKDRSKLARKLESQYSEVMFSRKPPAKSDPVKKLAGELRRIRDVRSGQLSITGEESIPAKLTLVLEALNKCAEPTDLSIESVLITARNISITGDTSSRRNTLRLFDALKETNFEILQQNLYAKDRRDNFSIIIEPRQ